VSGETGCSSLAIAPFALDSADVVATAAGIGTGLALIALSLPRGRLGGGHYGGWYHAILWRERSRPRFRIVADARTIHDST